MFISIMANAQAGCNLFLLTLYSSFFIISFEYGLSSALNAVCFVRILRQFLSPFIQSLPDSLFSVDLLHHFFSINPLAALLVFTLMLIHLLGIRTSLRVNNFLTLLILGFYQYANVLFLIVFDSDKMTNQPFFLNGHFGVMKGAAIAFLSYTSFETPITIAEEAQKPQTDIPRSLIRQIMIETIQYSILGYLVAGFVNIEELSEKKGQISSTEVSDALIENGYWVSGNLILIATLIGIVPAILDSILSQTRIMYRLSKDKLIGKIWK